jgi:hypothetical protein
MIQKWWRARQHRSYLRRGGAPDAKPGSIPEREFLLQEFSSTYGDFDETGSYGIRSPLCLFMALIDL